MTQASTLPSSMTGLLAVPEDAGEHDDLCDTYQGRYLDVIRSDVDNTWRCVFDNREVVGPQVSRDVARFQLLHWLVTNVLPKTRGGANRGQGRKALSESEATVSITLRMTSNQRAKLHRLGGAAWVRARLDETLED